MPSSLVTRMRTRSSSSKPWLGSSKTPGVADCDRWPPGTATWELPGKGGLVSEDVDKTDAAESDVDAERSDLEGVEVITTVVGEDGTVVIDDLVAEVDEEGHIVATDERLEID